MSPVAPPGMVRALPLWQPWASLVVLGAKQIETRPKAAPSTILGRRVAIHACATDEHLYWCTEPFFRDHLATSEVPLGALIGSVEVVDCEPITKQLFDSLSPVEQEFGNYAPGRWAWHLERPLALPNPVPWKASQGIGFVSAQLAGFAPDQEALAL